MLTNDQMIAERFLKIHKERQAARERKVWLEACKHPEQWNSQSGGVNGTGKTTPWAELWAFETDPAYLANLKVYYLDSIVGYRDGEWCIKGGLVPEDQLKKPKTRKKATPKLTHCPHCGMSLTEAPKAKPVPIPVPAKTRFVQVGNNFVPYRISA